MSQNVILTCDGSTATSVSGSFTLGADTGPNTYYIIYLTPNGGSDATPSGNVENNEVKVDVSNHKAGEVITFSIAITSPFTTTKGGILAVFAKDVNETLYNSKSNSLNCTEATATATPVITPTPTPEITPTPTPEITPTPTPEITPTPTPGGGGGGATPTPTPTPTPAPTATPTPTPTPTPQGQVSGATGTPRVTLPATDTSPVSAATRQDSDAWRIVVLTLAAILATVLLLTPVRSSVGIRRR